MDIQKELKTILTDSNLFEWDREYIEIYFNEVWKRYWNEDKDTIFSTVELREFWFYLKILLLSRLANEDNLKAIERLRVELNYDAKKFEIPKYTLKTRRYPDVLESK